jgi:hypothetical protein
MLTHLKVTPTTTPSHPDHQPHHTTTATINNGYAHLLLPTLHQTDVRLISHNINTLETSTQAELSTTFALYQDFVEPTILGIQECNKNWTIHDRTGAPLRDVITDAGLLGPTSEAAKTRFGRNSELFSEKRGFCSEI